MSFAEDFKAQIETIRAYTTDEDEIAAAFADKDIDRKARCESDPARQDFLFAVRYIVYNSFIFDVLNNEKEYSSCYTEEDLDDIRAARDALKEAFPTLKKIVVGLITGKSLVVKL